MSSPFNMIPQPPDQSEKEVMSSEAPVVIVKAWL
ncbi:uncharacterized protein G2W53_029365 [Senna tora]|uniref:Uncharacterized protein n=1 Tax=Senna tora TaxID=362788 RepID=A0A834T5B4_9FABA|nr:uncharacterized protein G2W53_029365 [Senna tora]